MSTSRLTRIVVGFDSSTPILGFTGPLGSGCTYVAKEIARQSGYFYHSLSLPVHEKAKRTSGRARSTFKRLQDIGNEMRRRYGRGVLADVGLRYADQALRERPGPGGIVLDGIRNVGEIEILRQFPNCFILAVHAERALRLKRLLQAGRVRNEKEFGEADHRDAEERGQYGQQLKRCTYLADVIFDNQSQIPADAEQEKQRYIQDSVVGRCLGLIQSLLSDQPGPLVAPERDEVLMTVAYCVSKRSSCLQRKVGAVLATKEGVVLSTGYNDVPEGLKSCLEDPDLGRCARGMQQEVFARRLRHCHRCGARIAGSFKCSWCGRAIRGYAKECPGCKEDPGIEYVCPKCRCNVFRELLPGAEPSRGRMLDVCRALHAEEKAILNLARHGSVPSGAILYTTTFPCILCAKKIADLGIETILFAEPYPMDEAREMLEKNKVKIIKFQGVKSSAFFRLYR